MGCGNVATPLRISFNDKRIILEFRMEIFTYAGSIRFSRRNHWSHL